MWADLLLMLENYLNVTHKPKCKAIDQFPYYATLRKSRPWTKFTGFLLCCGGVPGSRDE